MTSTDLWVFVNPLEDFQDPGARGSETGQLIGTFLLLFSPPGGPTDLAPHVIWDAIAGDSDSVGVCWLLDRDTAGRAWASAVGEFGDFRIRQTVHASRCAQCGHSEKQQHLMEERRWAVSVHLCIRWWISNVFWFEQHPCLPSSQWLQQRRNQHLYMIFGFTLSLLCALCDQRWFPPHPFAAHPIPAFDENWGHTSPLCLLLTVKLLKC